jgi:hypothetical protein
LGPYRPDLGGRDRHPGAVLAGRDVTRSSRLPEGNLSLAQVAKPLAGRVECRRHDAGLRGVRFGTVDPRRQRPLLEFAVDLGSLNADDTGEPLAGREGLGLVGRVVRRLWCHATVSGRRCRRRRRSPERRRRERHHADGDDDDEREYDDIRDVSTHHERWYV